MFYKSTKFFYTTSTEAWVYAIPGHWTGMDWTLDRLNLSSELITSLTYRGVAIAQ